MKLIGQIVPVDALIDGMDVSIYQLEHGQAALLATYNDLPSDANYLNDSLSETNQDFNELLDIEDQIS